MSGNGRGGHASHDADADTLRQTQHLLSIYPFASATPTSHGKPGYIYFIIHTNVSHFPCPVARHLSGLTLSAVPPSYYQPSYYTPLYGNALQQNDELSVLSAPEQPRDPQGKAFWDASQSEAIQLLGQDMLK